jgi:hypothetical protein
VVSCKVSSPYLSLAHTTKSDESSGGNRNCNVPRSYTIWGKHIISIGASLVVTGQPDNVVAIYGQDKTCVRENMMYHMLL